MQSHNAARAFFRYIGTAFYTHPSQCLRTIKLPAPGVRHSSSSSSTRWKSRQGRDSFAREAKVQGLKSRAAFKILEIDSKYKIFKRGQTVVDLGYAPGSWSQVAVERTKPSGRVVGIDIIPAQPPKGVSSFQGNFLSPTVQAEVRRFLLDEDAGRPRPLFGEVEEVQEVRIRGRAGRREKAGRTVDVVLSDMCAPWDQTEGFWKRTLSDPYYRMMNTTGIAFKDHTGSMDLCNAALLFAHDTLKVGGHFVCKFYQGSEDKELEAQLRRLFANVYREKPESSRSESKEAYFVALRRKSDPVKAKVEAESETPSEEAQEKCKTIEEPQNGAEDLNNK